MESAKIGHGGDRQVSLITGLHMTVCHYPPGALKWNPIEHRLFGRISVNWAGRPLRSLEEMQGWIRGTTTQSGLAVTTSLDERPYPKRRGSPTRR